MIRDFDKRDLDGFKPNEFSNPADISFVFDDDAWWLYTLENNGIKAIICFREGDDKEWGIFALISELFTARDSVEMRAFIKRAEAALKPKKVWTISLPIPSTDRWHKWLGFTFDKVKEFNGINYNMWVRTCV